MYELQVYRDELAWRKLLVLNCQRAKLVVHGTCSFAAKYSNKASP